MMKNKDNRYVLFPLKLYAILVNENPAIISWVPGGQSFRIHDIKVFASEITPKYFKCKLYQMMMMMMLNTYLSFFN